VVLVSAPDLETVLTAYVECALWSETDYADDSGGEPLDRNYGPEDIAPEALASMRVDCAAFIDEAGDLLVDWEDEQVGHDFWLTRNGHGAGFWAREWPNGDALSDIAHGFGTQNIYIGDDGRLYV
jgi:hypothetical protein